MLTYRILKKTLILLIAMQIIILPAYAIQPSKPFVVSSGIADDIAIPLFTSRHQDIDVIIDPISPIYSDLANKFITRDNHVDLYRLSSNLGIYQHLRSKGYFYDLSVDPTIKDFVSRLAEPFQNQISNNESILGVPCFFILDYPFVVNRTVAEAIGLEDNDFPTNLLDLLKFVNNWDVKYGDTFPEYFPFRADEASSYALAHRNPYIGIVLDIYRDTVVAQGQPLHYNTPLFIELLNEIKDWTYSDDQSHETPMKTLPDRDRCLFYSYQAFDYEVLNSICGNDTYINMPLTNDSPIVLAYELECAIINPATKNPDLAVELIRCYIEDCQPALLRLLCPDENAPYQDPDYQKHLQELQDWRIDETQSLVTISGDKMQEKEELLKFIDNLIQYEIENPYIFSKKAIEEYRTCIAPYLIARGEGIYESEAIYAETMAYSSQWLNGALSVEEYAKKLDDFLHIAVLEDS